MIKSIAIGLLLSIMSVAHAAAFSYSVYSDPAVLRSVEISSATSSRSCLTGQTRAILSRMEAKFGAVKVISTCRPGAVIAGSGRPSQHRYGKAVDFMPNRNRAAQLAWLRANAPGAVITYASGHIHFDTGGYRVSAHKGGTYVSARKMRRRR